jgi:hypothetical protein
MIEDDDLVVIEPSAHAGGPAHTAGSTATNAEGKAEAMEAEAEARAGLKRGRHDEDDDAPVRADDTKKHKHV